MVTVYAIDRPAGARFKGDLGFLPAFTAFNSEELASCRRCIGHHFFLNRSLGSFGCPGNTASGTTFRWMVMTLGTKSLLFFHAKKIGGFTIEAD
jgi:hypothetical protein